MTPQAVHTAQSRRESVARAPLRVLRTVALVMPLAIVATYYVAGWHAAVLAFPALWLAFVIRKISPYQRKRSFLEIVANAVGLVFLVAIPIIAVATDHVDVMRLWAFAFAIPLVLRFSSDTTTSNALTASRLAISERSVRPVHFAIWGAVGALFIAGSEILWLNTSLGLWIWYHAFALPLFLLFMAAMYGIAEWILGARNTSAALKVEPPPRSPGDSSPAAMVTSRIRSNGSEMNYGWVGLSQAHAICAGIDSRAEYRLTGATQPDSEFMIVFRDASYLGITPDGEETIQVRWRFVEAPGRGYVLGSIRSFRADHVPTGLTSELIDLSWADDWDSMLTRVRPYLKTIHPAFAG